MFLSYILVIFTFPLSLFFCMKVNYSTRQKRNQKILKNINSIKIVAEYQRAVIFRLGRNIAGGAKGPGLFFILPCIDTIVIIDLRTVTFDVN